MKRAIAAIAVVLALGGVVWLTAVNAQETVPTPDVPEAVLPEAQDDAGPMENPGGPRHRGGWQGQGNKDRREEMRKKLTERFNKKWEELFKNADKDGDGSLTLEESTAIRDQIQKRLAGAMRQRQQMRRRWQQQQQQGPGARRGWGGPQQFGPQGRQQFRQQGPQQFGPQGPQGGARYNRQGRPGAYRGQQGWGGGQQGQGWGNQNQGYGYGW